MNYSLVKTTLDKILKMMGDRDIDTYRSDLLLFKEQLQKNTVSDIQLELVRDICQHPRGIRDLHIVGIECGEWDVIIFDLLDAIES